MTVAFTADELRDLPIVISAPRFATYLNAAAQDVDKALDLYRWNAQVSSSFFLPLQICEVAVRNGVAEAIEFVHPANWPWDPGFVRSVPKHKIGFSPANELSKVARTHRTTGKVVADLNFAFWQHMFTVGQDQRLWVPHFATAFPGYDKNLTIPLARAEMHTDIDKVRAFRNRIAHHEPIFSRNLVTEYERIRQLVEWRRPAAATWLDKVAMVADLIQRKPIP